MAVPVFSQVFDPSALTNVANVVDQNVPGFPPSGPPGLPRIMADDFTLSGPTAVTLIRIFGGWLADTPPAPPLSVPHIHLTIYPATPGPGVEIFAADFGPVPGPAYVETVGVAALLGSPGGYFLDSLVPVGATNPVVPVWSVVNMYEFVFSPTTLVLPAGAYWLGISVDLPSFATSRFGWCSSVPVGTGSPCAFSPTPFGAPASVLSWSPILYPPAGTGPTHPLAGGHMDLAFEIEGGPPAPPTTTAPPLPTTTTTVPPTTTTGPPEDWHATWDGIGLDPSHVKFGTALIPAIPAGFFFPGSDPFAGTVELEGDPIGPGGISTVVQRSVDPFAPSDPPGAGTPIPIEIIELSLQSVDPIGIISGSAVSFWDIHVGLSVVPAPPSTLTATKTHANGGTFTADFFIRPKFIFTPVVPGSPFELDTGLEAIPALEFEGGGDWVHFVNDPLIVHPPGSQWVSLINEVVHGVPNSQVDSPMVALTADLSVSARHVVCPPRLPAPTTTTGPPVTTAPSTTTGPPVTTAPSTTTGPPVTTAPSTTTGPSATPHPADTTVGGLSGNEDFQIQSTEILAYAAAFLADDAAKFPGIINNRTAYVLRAAAIFLANFQARYEDVGTVAPVDSPLHPARWQELPDL